MIASARPPARIVLLTLLLLVGALGCADDSPSGYTVNTTNTSSNDGDGDGIINSDDNCPNDDNANQLDSDDDGLGDACDSDDDGDLVNDPGDNCPMTANPGQADSDGDGVGNACDDDDDNDGILDPVDNCPLTFNTDQDDLDDDGEGDACDDDDDGDGEPDVTDNCPVDPNGDQQDFPDGDGVGDVCDPDDDDDTVADGVDNCPVTPNTDQADADGDDIGDVCDNDTDTDGDGIEDGADNCPAVDNPGQEDLDGDGVGDACDEDVDGDGICDGAVAGPTCDAGPDNCPSIPNADQTDDDRDGIGDACDPEVAVSCGAGQFYEPIILPAATVAKGTNGLCDDTLCPVTDEVRVIDANLHNAARITVVTTTGSAFITATDTDTVYGGPRRVGIVVEKPGVGLTLNLIQSSTISTYLGGVEQDNSDDVGSGNVGSIGVAGQPDRIILEFPTSNDFDAARITFSNSAGTQAALDVFTICVADDS